MALAVPNAHAETYKDHNIEFAGYDSNGNKLLRFTSHPDYIESSPNVFVPYIVSENDRSISFESANLALSFNKDTCSLAVFNDGKISQNDSPMIRSISSMAKQADASTDTWEGSLLNQNECHTEMTRNDNGITIKAVRNDGNPLGLGSRFETVYDISYADQTRITYRYANNDITKLNEKYGFTQVLSGNFKVRIGDSEYSSQSETETIITKDLLNDQTIQISSGGFSILYDTENYIHDYLWAVKIGNGKLILDFTHAKGAILPTQTLEVDPTFGYTTATEVYTVQTGTAATVACPAATTTIAGDGQTLRKYASTDPTGYCLIESAQWNIGSIPDDSVIQSVNFKVTITAITSDINCNLSGVSANITAASPQTLYDDITNTGTDTDKRYYLSNNNYCTTAGTKTISLGTNGTIDVGNDLALNRFAVGITFYSLARDAGVHSLISNTKQLEVIYAPPPPPQPTSLTAVSQARKALFNWTTSNGTGTTAYYLGRSLDNATWPAANKTSTGNVTSLLSTAYWRINQLYYVNVTASNGLNSTAKFSSFTTDTYPSVPLNPYSTAMSESWIKINYSPPNSNGNDSITAYRIESCVVCTSWTLDSNSTTTLNYNKTGLTSGQTVKFRVAAWNGVGLSPYTANFTGQSFATTTGTIASVSGNVGDVVNINATITISAGSPVPFTIQDVRLYRNNTLVQTNTTDMTVSSVGGHAISRIWYQITNDALNVFHVQATVTNSTGTVNLSSGNTNVTREYDPAYVIAIDPAEGAVNATTARSNGEDTVNIKINRNKGGAVFNVECLVQTNFQAQFGNGTGTWYNRTQQGYYNVTVTGMRNTHLYGTCYNSGELLTFTSYTNSSLALFGIAAFDNSYGSFIGVPVGVLFIAMAAAMASQRTAPTWIVVVLGMIGIMTTVGFFTINSSVWALAIVAGMLGLFVGRKFF